jgi:hypothetical protein
MPKYRVQVEFDSPEELKRILFPEEKREPTAVSGVYIVRAKTAVTAACRQVLMCRMDIASTVLDGVLEELAGAMQTAVLQEEEEEINRALKIVNDLVEKLNTNQVEAVKFCCKWMGKSKCQVQCIP